MSAERDEKVVQLPRAEPAVPAIGISFAANIPEGRQVTAQTFVALDDSEDERNRVVDIMAQMIDRQRARYEIEQLQDELYVHKKTLSRLEEDSKLIEHEYNRLQARRRAELKALEREVESATKDATKAFRADYGRKVNEIAKLDGEKDALHKEGYDEFVASGRQGEYTPTGYRAANIARKNEAIAKAREDLDAFQATQDKVVGDATMAVFRLCEEKRAEIDKATAEHGQHTQTTDISKRRYRQEIDERVNKIRKRRLLVGQEPGDSED